MPDYNDLADDIASSIGFSNKIIPLDSEYNHIEINTDDYKWND
jgi:hypothetical protein